MAAVADGLMAGKHFLFTGMAGNVFCPQFYLKSSRKHTHMVLIMSDHGHFLRTPTTEGHLRRNKYTFGTSLAVQWLRVHASTVGGTGSIPGWGTKIPHAAGHSQKKKYTFIY